MAIKARKDLRGRALKEGEYQRSSDKRYVYSYKDPSGIRRSIYAYDLATLREKEEKLKRDQLDGLDIYTAGKSTLNEAFDRYISTKYELRENTRIGYLYTYDRYVRDDFGMKKLKDIKYSDILHFYYYLLNERGISIGTLDSVHCLLHPTFDLAVRDDIIRKNPTDGVMKEISKKTGKNRGIRHALTVEEQKAFMGYVAEHPVFYHWWPIFAVLFGTGCRIGECLGLRWQDLDFDKRLISINHGLVYVANHGNQSAKQAISLPKTEAGVRVIPMLDIVKDAFEFIQEVQQETGTNVSEIDGMSGFVFANRFGSVPQAASINKAIKRIREAYNSEEVIKAKKEKREPLLLPEFSCHHFRHTFATRLCETENNLKIIQSVMGHRNIETTMDIYAEATERGKREAFDNLSVKLSDIF